MGRQIMELDRGQGRHPLNGIKVLRGHILPRLASWFFPVAAITLGRYIICREEDPKPRLIRHELIHVFQQRELGLLNFLMRYLYYWLYYLIKLRNPYDAYLAIPFEKEAYDKENERNYYSERKAHAWRDYV